MKRRGNHQEFPALPLFAHRGNVFQIQAVGADHPHGGNLQRVDWVGHTLYSTGNGFAVAIREEGCRLSIVQEDDRVRCGPALPSPS